VAESPADYQDNGGRKLAKGVSSKDMTLFIIKNVGADGANYKAIEYYGSTIRGLSMAERMTLCNMSIEMGAKTGIVPPDEKTFEYLQGKAQEEYAPVHADKDAKYCEEYNFDVEILSPRSQNRMKWIMYQELAVWQVHLLTRFL